jgi:hypothetical protein
MFTELTSTPLIYDARMKIFLLLVWTSTALALNPAQIEQLTGLKGKLDEKEGVFKVALPRNDLKVVAGRVRLTPPMGLTSWAAFTRAGEHTMVMGDLCLTEDQVNPVMSVALDNDLEVTALHNHFFWDTPRVMFMHIGGMGDEAALAAAVGKVFAAAQKSYPAPRVEIDAAKSAIDAAKIDAILGKGEMIQGIYKVVIGRSIKMGAHAVGKTMGVNTWAAFAGSDDKAVVDGDFAMLESELQPVLKALRKGNINVVAIHQHMTGEQPRMMFLHYWGIGSTVELAGTLKTALARSAAALP